MAKILIVDDDPEVRALTCLQLRQGGHSVVTAAGGHAALALIQAEAFDLLITDMRMPEMNGAVLIGEVRKLSPALPIVALTGGPVGDGTEGQSAQDMGAHLLGKPLRGIQLREAVARVLDNQPAAS